MSDSNMRGNQLGMQAEGTCGCMCHVHGSPWCGQYHAVNRICILSTKNCTGIACCPDAKLYLIFTLAHMKTLPTVTIARRRVLLL